MANSTTMTPAEREAYWKGMEEAAKMLDEIVSGMAAHTDSAGNITGEDFHVPEINYIRCAAEDIRSLIASEREKVNADAVPQAEQTGPLAPAESASLPDAATVQVPREPTEAMFKAGYAAAAFPRDPEICAAMYRAMLSAAPAQARGLDAPADAGKLVEALADLEHQQWIEWAKSILDKEPISDARYARWIALFRPYAELTEAEKEQDRVWARKAAAALEAARPSEEALYWARYWRDFSADTEGERTMARELLRLSGSGK